MNEEYIKKVILEVSQGKKTLDEAYQSLRDIPYSV